MRGFRAALGILAEFVWVCCLCVMLTFVICCAMLDSRVRQRGGGST